MEKVHVFHNGERVWSTSHIQNNTFFGPYQGNPENMVSRILTIQEPAMQFQDKDKNADVQIEDDEQIWLQIVPGALCKWDPTMEMIRGPDNEIYLRTTRDIMPREELRAWFSASLERELGISKNDADVKSIGQDCPTCNMINQRSLLSSRAVLHRDGDTENTELPHHRDGSPTDPRDSPTPYSHCRSSSLESPYKTSANEFDLESDFHNLHSAFHRFANKKFTQLEDPKLASLISSFSETRHFKDVRAAETLADHHKKEFRKKFQGNEHYLRKHLYREDMNGRSVKKFALARFSEEEQRFLTTITVQKPIKFEKLDQSCHSHGHEITGNEFHRHDNNQRRELDMEDGNRFSRLERHRRIWNPFRSYAEGVSSTACRKHTAAKLVSLRQDSDFNDEGIASKVNCTGREDAPRIVTCRDSVCSYGNSEEPGTRKGNSDKDDNRTEIDESDDNKNTKKTSEVQSPNPSGTEERAPAVENADQRPLISHYYHTAPRPWLFPNPSVLSSVARRELALYHDRATTFSLASLSRYQHVNPFAMPYGIPSSTQSQPRVSQGFTCDFCGKVYCRKYVLKIHMRTHTGFKPLKCKFCDKSFSDPSNMKKHVKLHETENTVHKCKHCGRNFVRYRGLLNHIKSKHTEPLTMGILL